MMCNSGSCYNSLIQSCWMVNARQSQRAEKAEKLEAPDETRNSNESPHPPNTRTTNKWQSTQRRPKLNPSISSAFFFPTESFNNKPIDNSIHLNS